MRSCFTHFCNQDGAELDKYLPKLWGSARRINAQILKFNNLREQVFHRNKMERRGRIRKAQTSSHGRLPLLSCVMLVTKMLVL